MLKSTLSFVKIFSMVFLNYNYQDALMEIMLFNAVNLWWNELFSAGWRPARWGGADTRRSQWSCRVCLRTSSCTAWMFPSRASGPTWTLPCKSELSPAGGGCWKSDSVKIKHRNKVKLLMRLNGAAKYLKTNHCFS